MKRKRKTVKLKTINQMRMEFESISDVYREDDYGSIEIEYNGMEWWITSSMYNKFGTSIEVEELNEEEDDCEDYTHYCRADGCYYHKSWFEPEFEDFLKEEEMAI